MNLYDLTVAASNAVDYYKSPDLDEWITQIDEVLYAAGESVIGNDRVEHIRLDPVDLCIHTSYSVRCCRQTNDLTIPVFILKSDDPLRAAYEHRLTKALARANYTLEAATKQVENSVKEIEALQLELANLAVSKNTEGDLT